MAKIGVIHYNWPGFSLEEFLKFAAETGYRYVELQINDVWTPDVDNPERNAERVRKLVESYGLQVSALAAGNDFLQVDEDAIRYQVERMKQVCRLTRILGEEAVVRSEGGAPKENIPRAKWLDALTDCFRRCLDFVDEMQVALAIDNHGYVTNDYTILLALLQRLNHPLIGTNLDTMNYRWYGHDLQVCKRIYELMAPYAKHTHFKDGFGSLADYRGAALGGGEIDLQYALDCLKKAGYNGVYCAEYEGPEAAGGVGYAKCYHWLKEHV